MSVLVDLVRARGGSLRWHDALVALRELPTLPDDHDDALGAWFAALCERVAAVHSEGRALGDLDPWRVAFVVEQAHGDDETGHVISAQLVDRPDDVPPSPFYMSPARFEEEGNDEAEATDDVYALGTLLYEGLTLQRPFTSTGRAPLRTEVRRGVPPEPRRLRPRAHPFLGLVAVHALARRPARRHADAGELVDDVRRALLGVRPHALRPSPWARGWTTVLRSPGKSFLRVAATTLLVAAVGFAAWTQYALRDADAVATEARAIAAEQQRVAEERLVVAERYRAEAESASERWREASDESRSAQQEGERASLVAARAEQAAELARQNRATAAWDAYVTSLHAVVAAQDAGDAATARTLLARCPAELRGWLWDHLAWQVDPATSWTLPGDAEGSWSADIGTTHLAAWRDGELFLAPLSGEPAKVSLPPGVGLVTSACWLPEGSERTADLLVGDMDGDLHFLRMNEGAVERTDHWTGPTSPVRSLAVTVGSTTGRRVTTGHDDGSLWVWSLDEGVARHTCRAVGTPAPITHVAADASGALVAATTTSGVALWDAETGRAIDVFTSSSAHGAAFAPDGRRVVLLVGERLEVWDALRGDRLAACTLGSAPRALTFVDGGARALVGCRDGSWRTLTTEPLAVEALTSGHDGAIVDVRAFDDGRVVSVAADGVARLGSRALSTRCPLRLGGPARQLDVAGDRLVVTSVSGDVHLLDARTGHVLAAQNGQAVAALDVEATALTCIDRAGVATLWSARTGELLGDVPLAVGRVEALAVASRGFGTDDGRTLALGAIAPDGSRSVRVLDVQAGGAVSVLGRFDVGSERMESLTFEADGTLVLRAAGVSARSWRWVDGDVVEGPAPVTDSEAQRLTRDGRRRVALVDGSVTFTERDSGVVLARWASDVPIVDALVTDADAVAILDENGVLTMRHRHLADVRAWCEAAAHRTEMRPFVDGLAVEGITRDEALTRVAEHLALDAAQRDAASSLIRASWRRAP